MSGADVLFVCMATTPGWREGGARVAAALEAAGASVDLRFAPAPRDVRTLMLTDWVQSGAARRATLAAGRGAVTVYGSVGAALRWPWPGAIWFDSTARENRPGRHGVWQRMVERRRLAAAPLLLPWSAGGLDPYPELRSRAVVVHSPVDASGPPAPVRAIDVVAYAANPVKKGLDRMLSAWATARGAGERMVVTGVPAGSVRAEGVETPGLLPVEEYRALLRRSRVFLAAPVREDYGIAQLEALADGCLLVTTPSSGPYPARDIARRLDPRLVSDDLAAALRTALDDPAPGYAGRAAAALAPYATAEVTRTLAERVLPVLFAR